MAYFDCIVGGSGKGNTLVVTCADDLAGATITCTNGTKTYNKTCPSTAPYEVTFYGLAAGTWTVSATVSGNTYTATVVVVDCTALLGGFNWRTWVDTAQFLDSTDYASLSEVLADEEAVRELCLEHACVDYLAGIATTNAGVETIINTDLFAKWVNNSDYSLDTLGANTTIKALMDEADKYGYGEWVITDDTTTPPTWGAKGNVPVMTSNTAPYGEASASNSYSPCPPWHVFDGSDQISGDNYVWASGDGVRVATLTYKSVSPIRVAMFMIQNSYAQKSVKDFIFQGSNDGSTWENLLSDSNPSTEGQKNYYTIPNANRNYYLYHRISVSNTHGTENISIANLQFYGRELSVSVPTMTSDTTPYGEAIYSSAQGGQSGGYYLESYGEFNTTANHVWASLSNDTELWCGYDFKKKVKIKGVYVYGSTSSYAVTSYKVQASNSGNTDDWVDISNTLTDFSKLVALNPSEDYRYWRIKCLSGGYLNVYMVETLQFYGLDYSEKEFEAGTTKKWLYDHGVELETFVASPSYSGHNIGTYTKNSNNIQLDVSGASCDIALSVQLDCTPYNYLMCKGRKLTNNANQYRLSTSSTAYLRQGNIGYYEIQYTVPENSINTVDVSSLSQQAYCGVYLETSNTANATSSMFEELWLE